MVGPDYHRPIVAEPASFMGTASVQARAVPADPNDTAWWSSFRDPLLTKLVQLGLDQNLDVAQAAARVTQARASLKDANAALLPSGGVQASASAQRFSERTLQGNLFNEFGVGPHFENYEIDASLSWEIDLFGGLRRDREAAVAEYQASSAGVAAARLTVAAEVAETYVTIRGLQARIDVVGEQLATQQRLAETIGLQYRKGVASELQWRQAAGAQEQVASQLPGLRLALDAALNAMDVLVGAQPGTHRAELMVPGSIPIAPAITHIGTPADLLQRRPDLVIAERKLAASNARIGSAISEYFPKVSLSGLIGSAAEGPAGLFTGGATQASGVAGLRWRLFDFGRVDAEIKSARGRNAEALAAYRLSVLRATEDVEDSFSALVNREAQARSLVCAEENLQRARQSSSVAFSSGAVSLIEVLDADSRLLSARDGLAQAQTEAVRSAIASYRALGGGWTTRDATRLQAFSEPASQAPNG